MTNCIFCKIVNGEIPCYKIYENEKVMAFLDANPVAKGHTLIVPKNHFENIFDIDEEKLKEIVSVSKKIALNIKENLNADGINFIQNNGSLAGQAVFHYHLHVIPRFENDKLSFWTKMEHVEEDFEGVKNKIKGELK